MKGKGNLTIVASTVPSVLIACGIISYFIGLLNGFIKWSGTVVLVLPLNEWSFTFSVSSIWFFAVYPIFSLIFIQSLIVIPSFGISPLSLCFLLLAGLSLTLVSLRRLLWGFLLAFSAVGLGIIQFILISIIGFSPIGTNLTVLPAASLLYVIFFAIKNVVPLLVSEAFLVAGIAVCLHRIYLVNKRLLEEFEVPSFEHFRILKHISWEFVIYLVSFFIFLVLMSYYWPLARVEFPNYYPFIDLLNIYRIAVYVSLPVLNWLYLLVFFSIQKIFRNLTMFLAEKYVPLIEKKVENSVQPVDKIKGSIGFEKVDNRTFKALLDSVTSVSKRKSGIVGTFRDFLYDKKFLVQIVEKEIEKQGQADMNKIASELLIPSEILTVIYHLLIMEGFIKDVKLTEKGFIIKKTGTKIW